MNTWEANIRKVVPYTPGEQPNQPDMIKLNTNENPYPPAPGVEKALHGRSRFIDQRKKFINRKCWLVGSSIFHLS